MAIGILGYKARMIALPRLGRACGLLLGFTVLVGAGLGATGGPATAQDFSWFGGFLGGGTPQRSYNAPTYPGYDTGGADVDSGRRERRHRAQRRKKPQVDQAQQAAPAKPKTPVKNATVFVGVFGDSLGVLLSNGLDEALADRPEVGVIHKAKGSTGLVAESFYNWPKTIDDYLARQPKMGKDSEEKTDKGKAEKDKDASDKDKKSKVAQDKDKGKDKPEKIDVAVMMIGSNDRQPISQDGKTYQRGSEEWNTIYRKRVTAIAEAFQKKKIPLIWVGIPITKDDDFADDMAALNEIYRDVASKTGATYVDTWEAFSDDTGKFAAFGPDINGQNVRLRSSDGIHFTPAGARKLAHFVETPVRHDLDGKMPPPQLPTAETPSTDGKDKVATEKGGQGKDGKGKEAKPSVALMKPEAGPIKNLGDAPSAKDGQLAQTPHAESPVSLDQVATKGSSDAAPPGRADNFRWPAAGAPQP